MNKFISTKYNENYYEEMMDNGLKVVVWHKPNFKKSFVLMATSFGGFDTFQYDSSGREYNYHSGLAHFLEHKMFEVKNGNVFDDFSKMGADVNAATTYDSTSYYFQTSGDIEKTLNLLLDFTQELFIDENSVEKEKNIIVQELKMYQQTSDFRLVREAFESAYINHPLKYDIGGDEKNVNEITLNELKLCFKLNYHPTSMICIIVSGKDHKTIFEIVRNNQRMKEISSINPIKRKIFDEPKEVVNKNNVFYMDVNKPKINIIFKLNGILEANDKMKMEVGLRFILDSLFTSINDNYQKWINEGIINDYFGYDYDFGIDYGYLMIYSETYKKDEFIQLIFDSLKNVKSMKLDYELFNQLKKRYYGENVRELNDFETIAFKFMEYSFNDISYFEIYDLIENIELKEINSIVKTLNFENYSIIECLPMNEKSDF